MKLLKNWDNNTWLSSKKYISSFGKFLKSKSIINKETQILDIGCGRGNIISFLQKKTSSKVRRRYKRPLWPRLVQHQHAPPIILTVRAHPRQYRCLANRCDAEALGGMRTAARLQDNRTTLESCLGDNPSWNTMLLQKLTLAILSGSAGVCVCVCVCAWGSAGIAKAQHSLLTWIRPGTAMASMRPLI